MRSLTKDEFLADAPILLDTVGEDVLIIKQDQTFVAALVSQADFEEIRRARGSRAMAAMRRLSDAIEASGATEDDLRELEKALDRKA